MTKYINVTTPVEHLSVPSGSVATVHGAGVATLTTVLSGGQLILSNGGQAIASTLKSGAIMVVSAGGTATFTDVASGAKEIVYGGALATDSFVLSGGSLNVTSGGTITDTTISGGATVMLGVGAKATGNLTFSGSGATLDIVGMTGPQATIENFASGDVIDLSSFAASTAGVKITYKGDTATITQGSHSITLSFVAPNHNLEVVQGLDVTTGQTHLELVCFYAGTAIATPAGAVPVEALRPGDTVLLADGSQAAVRWLGRQSVARRFADPLTAYPIRIRAGALAEALPARDLLVSPSHAILLDGALVQAGALVNGASITRVAASELPETFAYYHVELATHALLLAEGVAAESFVDHVERVAFDNWAEHAAMVGAAAPIAELPLPRVKASRQLAETTRRRLAARLRALLPADMAQAA